MSLFHRLGRVVRTYGHYRITMRELNRLSDRELTDIGINRYQIHNVATRASRGEYVR